MKRYNVLIVVFSIIFLLAIFAFSFAIYIHGISPTYIYDYNYNLFHDKLTLEQQNSIYQTVQICIKMSFFPLLITNVLTFILAGIFLFLLKPSIDVKKQ